MDDPIKDVKDKGLISFVYQEGWLEKAIRQHNPKVTIMLARTEPITPARLDQLDFVIMYLDRNN